MNSPANISEPAVAATLFAVALRRLSVWSMDAGAHKRAQAAAFAAELAQLGYRITNPDLFTSVTGEEYAIGIAELRRLRGADVAYVPLFRNFPDDLPNDTTYRVQRFLGALGIHTFGSGRFGADPVTQRQRPDLHAASRIAASAASRDSHVEWSDLTLADRLDAHVLLERWALDLLYGATPVKETLWPDIITVLRELAVSVQVERVIIKESLARLGAFVWDAGRIVARTPTDLLRTFACLRDQDVSLAENVALKGLRFSKPQRRMVVEFLDACSSLEEDLLRYRRLWISLSRWLHPGDFAAAHPRVARAFDDLRNDRIRSFESRLARADASEKVAVALERPGLLLRRLTWLHRQVEVPELVDALKVIATDAKIAPLPLLLSLHAALSFHEGRAVINKAGKTFVIGPRRIAVHPDVVAAVDELIVDRLRGTQQWGSVWIDPAIDRLVLPLQARKASEGLLNLGRGSRIRIGDTPVIRLFVYWHQSRYDTDLDLSVLRLDDTFTSCGHVGWNQYGSGADIAHSGDIQDAPLGAAEFVDITWSAVAERYLLPSVVRFRGEAFSELRACHAGWMNRRRMDSSHAVFDASTVADKFMVQQSGRLWIPFLVDTLEREIIVADLYSAGAPTIEDNQHFPALAARIASFTKAKPTYGALARWYVRANNARLEPDRTRAEITIGTDDACTINVLHRVGQGVTSF